MQSCGKKSHKEADGEKKEDRRRVVGGGRAVQLDCLLCRQDVRHTESLLFCTDSILHTIMSSTYEVTPESVPGCRYFV